MTCLMISERCAVPTGNVREGGGWEGGKGVGNGGSVAVGSGMEEAPSADANGKRGSGKWARV